MFLSANLHPLDADEEKKNDGKKIPKGSKSPKGSKKSPEPTKTLAQGQPQHGNGKHGHLLQKQHNGPQLLSHEDLFDLRETHLRQQWFRQ